MSGAKDFRSTSGVLFAFAIPEDYFVLQYPFAIPECYSFFYFDMLIPLAITLLFPTIPTTTSVGDKNSISDTERESGS